MVDLLFDWFRNVWSTVQWYFPLNCTLPQPA